MVCDEQHIKRVLSGDEEAFREIVETYKAYVFAIILNFIDDRFEAENIAQEVFLQTYRSLPQYRFQSFKGWIGRIAVNKALDYRRKEDKRKAEMPVACLEERIAGGGRGGLALANRLCLEGNTIIFSGHVSPEEIVVKKEEMRRIGELCRSLPEIYRTTLEKFYLQGKNQQEIAEEEGTSVRTVESRLYRARSMLREKWKEGE